MSPTFLSRSLSAMAIALACACDDPAITVMPPSESGAPANDATAEGGFDLATCEACLAAPDAPGPGCGSEYRACMADSECSSMIACAIASGCFGRPASGFIGCAVPCAEEAGAVASTSVGLAVAMPLFTCVVNGACGPVCVTK